MSAVKVISVASGKGGVGKTNIATNLAYQMAKKGRRTLLLDADLGLANVDVLLGLRTRWNLSHVLSGECELNDVLIEGPGGISIIPAASGVKQMAELGEARHAGIVRALSTLNDEFDVLVVDSAAGISDSVVTFSQASQYVMVVVSDEPTAMADAYALIKVLHQDGGVSRFKILRNMVDSEAQAMAGFNHLNDVAQRFLDVTLEYCGSVPRDPYLVKSVARQRLVSELYPAAEASLAFRKLAATVDKWDMPAGPRGNIEFFVERMLDSANGVGMAR